MFYIISSSSYLVYCTLRSFNTSLKLTVFIISSPNLFDIDINLSLSPCSPFFLSFLFYSGVGVTVCCPGPISTGNDNQVRTVYGPRGMIPQKASSSGKPSKRVDAQIAAELIARAAYHKLDECWIAYHPVLLMGYLMQYLPWLGMKVLKRVGPGRVRQLRDGSGSGYDVGSMLK